MESPPHPERPLRAGLPQPWSSQYILCDFGHDWVLSVLQLALEFSVNILKHTFSITIYK